IEHFFHGHPADTLYDTSLTLAQVNSPVHAASKIMYHFYSIDLISTPQTIKRCNGKGCAINMIGEWVTFFNGLVIMNNGCGIMSLGAQVDPIHKSLLNQACPAE